MIQPGGRLSKFQEAKKQGTQKAGARASQSLSKGIGKSLQREKKAKLEELLSFSNQLAVLLEAGVPLLSSLNMLSRQSQDPVLRNTLEKVAKDINGGTTLTAALSKFPNVFSNLYVSMVHAAETGGRLAAVLKMLVGFLETQHKQEKKLKSAIVYPRFVLIFFLLLLAGVLFGLMPQFKDTFENLNTEMPAATQFLLDLSQGMLKYSWLETIVNVAAWLGFRYYRQTDLGRLTLDKIRLRIPVLKDLITKSSLSRFCRTLAISLASSVPLVEALEISTNSAQNLVYRHSIGAVRDGVIAGQTLAGTMAKQSIFPELMVQMVATGEQSGAVEKMLNNIADLYDTNIDARVASLSSIIEPALMIGLGLIAVIVIVALYLPIFNIGNISY